MEKINEKGLYIYTVSILLVTILEFILPYRPGLLNIVLHVLMFSKIPLTYIAILNLKYKNKESRFKIPILVFVTLLALFVVDFVSNIFCTINFYSADIELMELDFNYFFSLYILELLIESIAFFSLLQTYAPKVKRIIWALLSLFTLAAIITKNVDESERLPLYIAIVAVPIRIAMQYGISIDVADLKDQP